MATRISDIIAKTQMNENGEHHGKTPKFLALKGAFHGRTDRPAQLSDSCIDVYKKFLASFQNRDNLVVIEPNDLSALQQAFNNAIRDGVYFESMFLEPVMGEGNPGLAVTPDFYSLARKLCSEQGTVLVVDSIQAGLRAHGCLSIVDYPGFQELGPPDMEAYSKALNAGQYPLSVLALTEKAAGAYITGVYGNTMTTNPRALEVAVAVLKNITPALRTNIVEKGKEFLLKLNQLKLEFPDVLERVQGTGLLFSITINKNFTTVVGKNGLEYKLRLKGMGVIHGGENALRFTPHFWISSDEIDMMISILKDELRAQISLKNSVESSNNRFIESELNEEESIDQEKSTIDSEEVTSHKNSSQEIEDIGQENKVKGYIAKGDRNAYSLFSAGIQSIIEKENPSATLPKIANLVSH